MKIELDYKIANSKEEEDGIQMKKEKKGQRRQICEWKMLNITTRPKVKYDGSKSYIQKHLHIPTNKLDGVLNVELSWRISS